MDTTHRHHPTPPETAAAQRARRLRERLHAMGFPAAPVLDGDASRRLEDLDALLAQFVRATRHVSGTVRAYASLIGDAHDGDEDTRHWIARITRAIGDLDEFGARVTTLRVSADERPVEVTWNDVLARACQRCSGRRAIEVYERTSGPFRQRAETLGRAVYHLVRNASEASPRGARVQVRVDESRMDGERVFRVRVMDEGEGIDPAVLESMWQPFVTSKAGHAGLGLAYAAASATLLGAAVGIRREGGRTSACMLVGEEGGLQWA
jgi:signal transduction histidine kinase